MTVLPGYVAFLRRKVKSGFAHEASLKTYKDMFICILSEMQGETHGTITGRAESCG